MICMIWVLISTALAQTPADERLELASEVDAEALAIYEAQRLVITGVTATDQFDTAMKTVMLVGGHGGDIGRFSFEDIGALAEGDWEEAFNTPIEEMVYDSWTVFEGDSRRALPAWSFAEMTGDVDTRRKLGRTRGLIVSLGGLALAGGAAMFASPFIAQEESLDSETLPLLMGGGAIGLVGISGITLGLKTRTAPVASHYTPQRASALAMTYNDALRASLDLSAEATFGLELSPERVPTGARLTDQ